MEIFKLFGSVFVKTDEAEQSMSKVDKKGVDVAKSVESMTGKVNKFALGIAGAATAAATGLFALTVNTAETADEVDKMSERTGISRERLQELKYAAGQCGVEFNAIENGVKTLTKNMGKADDESKRMVDAFGDLGIAINDGNGNLKSSSDLFEESITKLAGMEDQTKRNILGQKIFGGSWQEMIPLINQGQDGIKALTDRSRELGLVMDEETVKANVVFGDTLDDIKQSAGAVGVKLANGVLPTFQKMLDWILGNMPKIQEVASKIFNALGDAISWVIDNSNWLIPILGGLLSAILALNAINTVNALMAAWKASTIATTFAQGGLNAVLAANPIGLVIIAIGALVAAVIYLWNNCEWFRNLVIAMFDVIKSYITDIVIPVWTAFKDAVVAVFSSIWDTCQSVWGNIKGYLQGVIDFVTGVFTGNWSQAWSGIVAIFSNLWQGISTIFKAPLNWMITGLNTFIRGINKIQIPDWVPGVGGMGINISEIPMLAKGTNYFKGGMAIVGEEGPELVEMPRGSKVIPNNKTEKMLNDKPKYVLNIVNIDGREVARSVAPYQEEFEDYNNFVFG